MLPVLQAWIHALITVLPLYKLEYSLKFWEFRIRRTGHISLTLYSHHNTRRRKNETAKADKAVPLVDGQPDCGIRLRQYVRSFGSSGKVWATR